MSKIIDLGDMVIVKKYITGAQLMTGMETSNTIRLFMMGVPNGIDIDYQSKGIRNEAFVNLKKELKGK